MLSLGLNIKNRVSGGGGGSYLPETTSFMTATAIPDNSTVYFAGTAQEITGSGLWAATDSLITELIAESLWADIVGYYPLIGVSATSAKFNLKNPLDTDAAFRMSWFGGMVFDGLGATANGTNAYGNTHINNQTHLNSASTFGWKNRVHNTIGGRVIGVQDYRGGAPRPSMWYQPSGGGGGTGLTSRNIQDDSLGGFGFAAPDNSGIFTVTTLLDVADAYRNSVFQQTKTETKLYTDRKIFAFCNNFTTAGSPDTGATDFSTFNLCNLFFYDVNFTAAQITKLETAINNFDALLFR